MSSRKLVLFGILIAITVAAMPAMAHDWGCWRQPNRTVYIYNTALNSSQANSAINEWDADTILSLPKLTSHTEVSVFDGNYGDTGWGGLASIESSSGCNILHGHATLNYFYSYTSNGKRGVFCQEIGHLFGLQHSNDGGCMGGGYYYDINTFYNVVSHNISDISAKYSGVPLAVTEPKHGGDEPGEEGPKAHALWYHNPRNLFEAIGLARAIVVAEVVGVYDAPDIVVPVKGLDNDEHRVPNQRIALTVRQTLKGNVGKSFDLFHTGNDTFVLADDPAYKIGEKYVLFLHPREDGSYRIIAPEGRFQVTRQGLLPVSHRDFAKLRQGTSLLSLTRDIQELSDRLPEQ